MFHLSRPAYLRQFLAVLVVVTAIAVELRAPTTEPLAVAATDTAAGEALTEADVRWVEVPVGLFPVAELPATLARSVPAGAPVTAYDVVATTTRFPADWLLIELEVPESTSNGAPVVAVVVTETGTAALAGVVAREPVPSDFGTFSTMVAFAPDDAVKAATSLMAGDVAVLLGG